MSNVNTVKHFQKLWDKQNGGLCEYYELGMSALLSINNKNTDKGLIFAKCVYINSAYSTHIVLSDLRIITDAIFNESDFDNWLYNDPDTTKAVNFIRGIIKDKDYYSFATKYCALHDGSRFPIRDKLSLKTLKFYQKKGDFCSNKKAFTSDLKNYKEYIKAYDEFIEFYNLQGLSYREVDKYLWTFSKMPKSESKKHILIK